MHTYFNICSDNESRGEGNAAVNRPYSDSRYWTGTYLQVRLMRAVFSNANEPPLQVSSSPIPRIRILSHYSCLLPNCSVQKIVQMLLFIAVNAPTVATPS